jgi:hypothetical protein
MSGRKHYDETHKKMSDSHKKIDHSGRFNTGDNHPNYGKPRSDEIRGKISLSMPNSIKIEVTDMPSFAFTQGQK